MTTLPMFKINCALVLQNVDYYNDFAMITLLYPMVKCDLLIWQQLVSSWEKKNPKTNNFKYQSKLNIFWVEMRGLVENRL